ncbi:patatin-like phospholipase family protein [Microbispora sp. NBC_01389]
MTTALVLGGGGVAGIALEVGIVTGLRRLGVDLGTADRVVGTSAGSVVGTLVATEADLEQTISRQAEVDTGARPDRGRRRPARRRLGLTRLTAAAEPLRAPPARPRVTPPRSPCLGSPRLADRLADRVGAVVFPVRDALQRVQDGVVGALVPGRTDQVGLGGRVVHALQVLLQLDRVRGVGHDLSPFVRVVLTCSPTRSFTRPRGTPRRTAETGFTARSPGLLSRLGIREPTL